MAPKSKGSRVQMRQNSAVPQNRVFGKEHFSRTVLQFQQRRPQVQQPCLWRGPLKIEEGDAGHGSDGVRRRRRTRFNRVRCHWWTVDRVQRRRRTKYRDRVRRRRRTKKAVSMTVSGAGAGQSRPSPRPCPASLFGDSGNRVRHHFWDPPKPRLEEEKKSTETVAGVTVLGLPEPSGIGVWRHFWDPLKPLLEEVTKSTKGVRVLRYFLLRNGAALIIFY